MEPIQVLCTTCGRKLRVRDPRLVGQIVACPKCQGMVLIPASEQPQHSSSAAEASSGPSSEAPTGQSPVAGAAQGISGDNSEIAVGMQSGAQRGEQGKERLEIGYPDVDSEAVTREGIVPASMFEELDEEQQKGLFASGSDALKNAWGIDGEKNAEPPIPLTAGSSDEENVYSRDSLPPVAWQSASSARTRQIAAVVAIAVTSLVIATTAFVIFVRSWKQSRQDEGIAAVGPAEVENPSGIGTDEPEMTSGDGADNVGDRGAGESLAEPATSVGPVVTDNPPGSSEDLENPDNPLSPDPATAMLPGQEPALPTPDELFPDSPGGADSIVAAVPEGTGGQQNNGEGDEEGTATELPPELAQYVQQLQLSRPSEVAAKNPLSAPPTIEELRVRRPELEFSATDAPLPEDKVDVRKQMGVKLIGANAQDQPMQRLLLVISQLTACPIQEEWLGLEVAGIELNRPVSLKEKDIEAGQLLLRVTDQAGARLGLSDGFVLIGPGNEANSTALLKAFDLSDLNNGEGIDPGVIRLLIGSVPGDLKVSIEPPMLLIEGSDQAKWRAALIVEAIRRARMVPPKLSESLTRWMVEVDDFQIEEGLGFAKWLPLPADPVTADSHQAEPVEWILSSLATSRGKSLVFDWVSAWERGLTPSAKVLPWYRGRGIDAVIAEVLEPYGMSGWDAGGGVWWVSTEQAYLEMPLVLVLGGGSAEQKSQIEEIVVGAAGQAVGAGSVWSDPISGKLVAVLPRYVIQEIPRTLRAALAK